MKDVLAVLGNRKGIVQMNMKPLTKTKWAAALLLAAMLLTGSWPARAQIVTTPITPIPFNAISETAGSTFLVPYFEVDLSNPNGRNTIFTINKGDSLDSITVNGELPNLTVNVAPSDLTHVTVRSDL